MSTVESAVSSVRIGRPPVMHKSGRPLKEIKNEQKALVAAAKQAAKGANDVVKNMQKTAYAAAKAVTKAENALAKAQGDEKLKAKDKSGYTAAVSAAKANLVNAKTAAKDANTALKAAEKNAAAAAKGVEKAEATAAKVLN